MAVNSARIRWDRISRYALLAVFGGLLFLYVNPARSYVNTVRESHHRQAQVAALRRDNHELLARRKALGNPAVIEAEARRLGMVRPGERSYVVRGLSRHR